MRWEPRLRVIRIEVELLEARRLTLTLEIEDIQLGRDVRLEGIRL